MWQTAYKSTTVTPCAARYLAKILVPMVSRSTSQLCRRAAAFTCRILCYCVLLLDLCSESHFVASTSTAVVAANEEKVTMFNSNDSMLTTPPLLPFDLPLFIMNQLKPMIPVPVLEEWWPELCTRVWRLSHHMGTTNQCKWVQTVHARFWSNGKRPPTWKLSNKNNNWTSDCNIHFCYLNYIAATSAEHGKKSKAKVAVCLTVNNLKQPRRRLALPIRRALQGSILPQATYIAWIVWRQRIFLICKLICLFVCLFVSFLFHSLTCMF